MKKNILIIALILIIPIIIFFLLKISGNSFLPNLFSENKVSVDSGISSKDKLLNKKVPYFDLLSLENKRIKFGDYVNKPLVIIFWTTWNIEGVNQLKIVDDYLSSNNNNIASILMINSQEDESVVKSFIRRGGYNVTTALDSNGNATQNFNIKSLPTAFFVDKDGIVHEVYSGVLSKSMLMGKVEQLIE
jgi:hypothetical protein